MRRVALLVLGVIMSAGIVHADQIRKEGFWEKLRGKLANIAPAKKSGTTTAVGGVRGAKNDEANDIYWKGKEKATELAEEELMKFNQAVESKLKGENETALKQFEEFLVAYPNSSLRVEGLQAVEKIKYELAAAKLPPAPPQVAPAAPAPPPAAVPTPAPAVVPVPALPVAPAPAPEPVPAK